MIAKTMYGNRSHLFLVFAPNINSRKQLKAFDAKSIRTTGKITVKIDRKSKN